MPVRYIGPFCSHHGCRLPAFAGGLCRGHWDLARAFGDLPPDPVLDHRSHEFSVELQAWLKGEIRREGS